MKTISLQIGNGDDKLAQAEWHAFVSELRALIERYCSKLHFWGSPEGWAEQQNAAFIFDLADEDIDGVRMAVKKLREKFKQESAAWTEGKTEFV